jgi:LysR family transcriptional regulator, nitrogen assimilation regulatory protein
VRPIVKPRLRSKMSLATSSKRPATATQQTMLELIRKTVHDMLDPPRGPAPKGRLAARGAA